MKMKSNVKACAILVALLGSGFWTSANVLVSNLGDSIAAAATNSPGDYVASRFFMGTQAGDLNSVTLSLPGSINTSEYQVFLYSNTQAGTFADEPNSLLEQLSYSSQNGVNYTFTSVGESLTAGQSYWVVTHNVGAVANYAWNYSSSFYTPDATGATIANYLGSVDGSSWTDDGAYTAPPQMFAVDIAAIPEAATMSLVGGAGMALLVARRFFKE